MVDTGPESNGEYSGAEWVDLRTAAELSGKSVKTVRRWVKSGKVVSQLQDGRHGQQYFVRAADLYEQAPEKQEVEETTAALRVVDEAFKSLQNHYAETVVRLTEEIEQRARSEALLEISESRVESLEAELEALKTPVEEPEPAEWDFDEEVSGSFAEMRAEAEERRKPWWKQFHWSD